MISATMIRASESLIWRKPRQFANNALADLTISHFIDSVSETTLKYFASMERRHGDKSKPVVSHLPLYLFCFFSSFSDAPSQLASVPGALCPRSSLANPGNELVDRVIETQSKLNTELQTLCGTIADLNQTIKTKNKLIETLENEKEVLAKDGLVSPHHCRR